MGKTMTSDREEELFHLLNDFYQNSDEDVRLLSQSGRLEYETTMHYLAKGLAPGMRILEIGAGTGRYSHALARMGYAVEAMEYLPHHIAIFQKNTQPGEQVHIRQGTATDLSCYADNAFDRTLLLGPMYHLFDEGDAKKALSEAVRVTRPGGRIFVAYCQSDAAIVNYAFKKGNVKQLVSDGRLDPVTFTVRYRPEDVFCLRLKRDAERLAEALDVTRLHYIGTDMATEYMAEEVNAMDEETFTLYLRYHFTICERADLVGASHHSLDILQKNIH